MSREGHKLEVNTQGQSAEPGDPGNKEDHGTIEGKSLWGECRKVYAGTSMQVNKQSRGTRAQNGPVLAKAQTHGFWSKD